MPKSETNLPIMTRSKKEGTFGDPKLSLNEVKNEATAKTILEKEKIDTPVVKQQVQSAKEIIKTDTIVEKKTLEQSVEKKFVIDKSTDKDRSSSKNDESLTLEKNKPKDPSASKKDESLILEKNKPKEEKRSALKKDKYSILEINKPKEEARPFLKRDEFVILDKNKPKDEVCSFSKKDEIVRPEKNESKEEIVRSSSWKDEFVTVEKNKPKEEVRSSSKKDESLFHEKNKPKEEVPSFAKKDEVLFHEKNKPKEENPSALKKDELLILEKNKPKEGVQSSSKKDEFVVLDKNVPKEEVRSFSKKDEYFFFETNIPTEELRIPSKKDECSIFEKSKSKGEIRSSSKKDEFVIVEKNKSKEDDRPSKKEELFIVDTNKPFKPSNVAVPRKSQPYVPPITNEPPIILATHLVPSLPIALFELLAEVIEIATERPVNILYEARSNRKVAKQITDIAVLSANEEWEDGNLLPVSFIFKHRLNKDNSPLVYADVIIASDLAPHVEDIIDMRGHRCALPDRSKKVGSTTLLYNYLHSVGEGPAFFGNTLDVDSQIAVLQMVAGKQAEVGILEAPVIMCHKDNLPGIETLRIVTSLGPLPPYRIMVNKALPDDLVRKLTSFLLNCNQDAERMEKLASYGILGFAINSTDFYEFSDVKSAIKRGPYY